MPLLTTSSQTTFYRFDGSNDLPVLMLSHSLGQDHSMWDAQAASLTSRFRVLRYDTRGHGASAVPAGDYVIEDLARGCAGARRRPRDLHVCLLRAVDGRHDRPMARRARRASGSPPWCLANTSPKADANGMEERRSSVLRHGMAAISDIVMGRFFSRPVLAAESAGGGRRPPHAARDRSGRIRRLLRRHPRHGSGRAAPGHPDADARSIGGELDVSLPWKGHGEVLASKIPDARVVHLPTAHLSNLERPQSFSAAVMEFLAPRHAASLEAGQRTRRAVLGDAHVDRAFAMTDDFTRDFQELLTRYAWGEVWSRPGLDHRTRRLVVLAMTAASRPVGRIQAARTHRPRTRNRALRLKELLLQVAIYAGVPAANTAFHLASEEMSAHRHLLGEEDSCWVDYRVPARPSRLPLTVRRLRPLDAIAGHLAGVFRAAGGERDLIAAQLAAGGARSCRPR